MDLELVIVVMCCQVRCVSSDPTVIVVRFD